MITFDEFWLSIGYKAAARLNVDPCDVRQLCETSWNNATLNALEDAEPGDSHLQDELKL